MSKLSLKVLCNSWSPHLCGNVSSSSYARHKVWTPSMMWRPRFNIQMAFGWMCPYHYGAFISGFRKGNGSTSDKDWSIYDVTQPLSSISPALMATCKHLWPLPIIHSKYCHMHVHILLLIYFGNNLRGFMIFTYLIPLL
jgi:hypothetical protein